MTADWGALRVQRFNGKVYVGNGVGDSIAHVFNYGGNSAEKNAHMIAAAPELLTALNDAMRIIREKDSFSDPEVDHRAQEVYARARAAVMKADGKG